MNAVRGILPSARPDLLYRLLISWYGPEASTREIPISLACHGHPWEEFGSIVYGFPLATIEEYSERYRPVYPSRVSLMQSHHEARTFINLDDDMEVIPAHTNYAKAITQSRTFGVGVISCAWAKSEALLAKALEGMEDPWIKQPIVNMAGGQVYGQHVVTEMAKRIEAYQFDDVQAALRAYVAGYDNWRYRGSVIYHRIMKPGGLKEAFAQVSHAPNDPEYMRMEESKPVAGREKVPENNRLMPSTSNLTPLAHTHHNQARAALGFR
jgi:hypothetical protein